VQTAVSGGFELLIFVRRAAHSQITLDDLGDDDIEGDEKLGCPR
jgi:hypothetical protein